ncbi:MAG: GNAT family N-acetyltransferase [Clostridia bacterium]|nr:GNAT family N-acetyltransferase [Clostridia bacterium]
MMIRKALAADFAAACELYKTVCDDMQSRGIDQWRWEEYPNADFVREDIEKGQLYVLPGENGLEAVLCINTQQDKEYDEKNWLFGVKPGSFHRLGIHPAAQGKGLGKAILADVEEVLRTQGCDCLRIDTYSPNLNAQKLYERYGMRKVGEVTFFHRELPFICYEKPITEACPLLPLTMHPAFRGGSLTPWGGEKLRTVYDKPIKDVPTGESLEVSCIPGLESTDDAGVKLTELITQYGARFAGKYAQGTFPLLLKLIDASESLSVQVHPDDSYAGANENGKLGKTEAWLILDAPEGSQLVYGIKPGTDLNTLRTACEAGAAVEPLLRRVNVKPGDVCFIPAGCVHAIGAGIMLYEIQQSSDVTYRFYDWDRVDKNGNRRELHLQKALDVTDLSFSLDPIPAPDAPIARVLDEEYFTLDLMKVAGECQLPAIADFGLLTSLEGDVVLCWQGAEKPLKKGESLYIPASAPELALKGTGRAALSMAR